MIKKIIFVVLIFLISYLLFVDKNMGNIEEITNEKPLIKKLLDVALSYQGTAYKFGGTTKAGMDCSGLVYTSYKAIDINLQRSSRNMYNDGNEVALKDVEKGDLLFFDIDKFEGRVNHVGMVTSVNDFEVNFIHSSSSKGVTISSINESYWKKAFIKAKRILE